MSAPWSGFPTGGFCRVGRRARFWGVGNVGGLVGYSLEDISSSWSFSKVSGREYVGGLAGYAENGDISSSWSSGAVSGISNVGGLAGYLWKGNASSSWSSGAVSGRWYVGGLVAFVREGSVSSSWSSGAVGGYYNVGGLVSGQPSAVDSYWGVESSGRESSTSTSGIGVDSMQTLSVSSWDADVWRFGGETDFPALVSMDADLQAAGVAAGFTRVFGINGSTRALNIFAISKIATDDPFAVLALDTNAAAADLEADPGYHFDSDMLFCGRRFDGGDELQRGDGANVCGREGYFDGARRARLRGSLASDRCGLGDFAGGKFGRRRDFDERLFVGYNGKRLERRESVGVRFAVFFCRGGGFGGGRSGFDDCGDGCGRGGGGRGD